MVILAIGGSIAARRPRETQSGYTSGAVTIDAVIAAVPGIRAQALGVPPWLLLAY